MAYSDFKTISQAKASFELNTRLIHLFPQIKQKLNTNASN